MGPLQRILRILDVQGLCYTQMSCPQLDKEARLLHADTEGGKAELWFTDRSSRQICLTLLGAIFVGEWSLGHKHPGVGGESQDGHFPHILSHTNTHRDQKGRLCHLLLNLIDQRLSCWVGLSFSLGFWLGLLTCPVHVNNTHSLRNSHIQNFLYSPQ